MNRVLLIMLFSLASIADSWAQPCTSLGQTPETAFPVCGTSTFFQASVPICSSSSLFVPGCSGSGAANYENKNPYWYRFTCFSSGTLGFVITPNTITDDYDWQLYDITGKPPSAIFTDRSIIVTGNWSGSYGATGASSSGVSYIQCASSPSDNAPTFAAMPYLVQGREYILLVSHFTDSQSGYSLSFQGGTAVITDPTEPQLDTARAVCAGTTIRVRLNKKMKCNSLAANGSDFSLTGFPGIIVGAAGIGCSASFDMEEVELTLGSALAPGNYTLVIGNGTDGNTLRDVCDRNIPVGESLNIQILPLLPTPMDSITRPGCAPSSLEIIFRNKIKCGTITANGSEFTITGPSAVSVTSAVFNCDSGYTNRITLNLNGPIQLGGIYNLLLQDGDDGNTFFDECALETPDTSLPFVIKDTVSADFSHVINYSCTQNTVNYSHDGRNGVNSWNWTFGNGTTSGQQNTVRDYQSFVNTTTRLIVSNGVCSDTVSKVISFDNLLIARFEVPEFLCPGEQLTINNTTTGNVASWNWDLGNGIQTSAQTPAPSAYPVRDVSYNVLIRLEATNQYGCSDTFSRIVKVVNNCFIAVPSAFTPNNDGLNDFLYPLNAYKARDLKFSVFNRFGQRIFYTADWTRKWDGRFKGQPADPGTYVWMLSYIDADTGRRIEQKGSTVLIR